MVNVIFNHLKIVTRSYQCSYHCSTHSAWATVLFFFFFLLDVLVFGFVSTVLEKSCFSHLGLSVSPLHWSWPGSCVTTVHTQINMQQADVVLRDYMFFWLLKTRVEKQALDWELLANSCKQWVLPTFFSVYEFSTLFALRCQLDVLSDECLLFITAQVVAHVPSMTRLSENLLFHLSLDICHRSHLKCVKFYLFKEKSREDQLKA